MADLTMPRLSDSMGEGTVLRWLKASGDPVKGGEEIVEIETDKATMPVEAGDAGILEIVAAEGETVSVGALLARIHAHDAEVQTPSPATSGVPATETPQIGSAPRVKASPLARRIATERGLDLRTITGTDPGGRILRSDVQGDRAALPASRAVVDGATVVAAAGRETVDGARGESEAAAGRETVDGAKGATTLDPITATQRVIAERMASSKGSVPDFMVEREIDMEACAELRAGWAGLASAGPQPTYNDMIIKACAIALREQPRANGAYRDDGFERYERVNVGFAVASADALLVPTVKDADRKSLSEIAAETRELADRARARAITPAELAGGTFTVSNLGMLGVDRFTAVINAPQSAILATGAVKPRPVARGDEVVVRRTMNATLICDHRILYGADGARLLARISELLERPVSLFLGPVAEASAAGAVPRK